MAWQEEARDYLDAGLRLIPLHPIVGNKCGCEKESRAPCASIGKHPLRHGWQNQALIDDATLGNWSSYYQCSGLGWALDDDHIVIDVDSRSGGLESLNALQLDLSIDFFSICNAIVKTGGGGWHFYFKKDPGQTIGWKMPEKYRGIDIKQGGGFIVIAGSMHASGAFYEWHSAAKSDLSNLCPIPQVICEMLAATKRAHVNEMKSQGLGDVTEIADMLDYISNDGEGQDYEMWLRIGMSIHHATAGGSDGLKVFSEWSKQSSKYDAADLERRWHSFGKRSSNVATLGSLVYIARQAGWQPAIDTNAMTPEELADLKSQWDSIKAQRVDVPSIMDDADIDLYRPMGLLGQINDYVYACSPFPNQNLSLACALAVLTNAIGRRYYWPGRFASIQPNMLILCEAGSSVGKDSILGAAHRLLCKIGMGPALHGRIKSDKDLLDAIERNQYACYFNDEFGYFLQRLNNAMKKGNATYLEGIIATIMEVFTKGDKTVLLDISRKQAIKDAYTMIINKSQAVIDSGELKESAEKLLIKKVERAKFLLNHFEDGIPEPFLAMFTTATPRTMNMAFTGESTENGFLSRAMVFKEYETNPRPRADYAGTPDIPVALQMALMDVAFEKDDCSLGRVDSFAMTRQPLKIEADAQVFVDRAVDYFFDMAEIQKDRGLESLPRRALDSIVKVCIALGAQEGVVSLPMARYAVKLTRHELERKILRVTSTENMESRDKSEKLDGISSRIIEICSIERGLSVRSIYNAIKTTRLSKDALVDILGEMVKSRALEIFESGRVYNKAPVMHYRTISP